MKRYAHDSGYIYKLHCTLADSDSLHAYSGLELISRYAVYANLNDSHAFADTCMLWTTVYDGKRVYIASDVRPCRD